MGAAFRNLRQCAVIGAVFVVLSFAPLQVVKELPGVRGARALFHVDEESLEFNSKKRQTNEFENLRFLFFGTSRTYGTLLADRLNEAYPFLLSPNTVNLAIPGSTPTFPCKCVKSMIDEAGKGNDPFDVIVLEFDRPFREETIWLVRRLRQRFPNAYIIVLELWLISFHHHKKENKYLNEWAFNQGFAVGGAKQGVGLPGNPELIMHVIRNSKVEDWSLQRDKFEYDQEDRKRIEDEGAVVLSIPVPENGHHAMLSSYEYFINDMNHYNPKGHKYIRDLILQELRQVNFRTHTDGRLNPWKSPDSCKSWFRSGRTELEHSKEFKMNEFKEGKFALETRNGLNWIEINNPLAEEADLYIERMVTSPKCMYPRMLVQISGSNEPPVAATCEKLPWHWEVNVSRGLYIGRVPPGKSVLEFRRDPTDESDAPWPFRLLGISVTSPENSINKGWELHEAYT